MSHLLPQGFVLGLLIRKHGLGLVVVLLPLGEFVLEIGNVLLELRKRGEEVSEIAGQPPCCSETLLCIQSGLWTNLCLLLHRGKSRQLRCLLHLLLESAGRCQLRLKVLAPLLVVPGLLLVSLKQDHAPDGERPQGTAVRHAASSLSVVVDNSSLGIHYIDPMSSL